MVRVSVNSDTLIIFSCNIEKLIKFLLSIAAFQCNILIWIYGEKMAGKIRKERRDQFEQ